jgi:V/A-type H+-transporting ATPase subunit E
MAEELKDLIAKIQQEGVDVARQKADEIESKAKAHAASIVENATKDAEKLIAQAKQEIARMESSARESLRQAGRDLLISLRKQISSMLDKIVTSHVHKALSIEEIAKIISALVKESHAKADGSEIVITMKKDDLEKMTKGMLADLRDEIKKGITLKSSDEIHGGFVISYDSGKSYYDFTDAAIAKYITAHINAKLSDIFNGASS